jgi:hypothetical protein
MTPFFGVGLQKIDGFKGSIFNAINLSNALLITKANPFIENLK